MQTIAYFFAAAIACTLATPVLAQEQGEPSVSRNSPQETVYDGDYISVGGGMAYGPSYTGSDDYTTFVAPIVQGSVSGIEFTPRASGLAVDFIADPDEGLGLDFGPVARLNRDRVKASKIKDPVVAAYGELDTAIEVGANVGMTYAKLFNPYDSLSVSVDTVWDVAGAHGGMAVYPGITYFTPLSRGIAAAVVANGKWIDGDYADYYYSVPPTNAQLPAADLLPGFEAESGVENYGINLILGFDLNGDLADGGFALVGLAGYSKLTGDAKDSPFTSIRGDADQWLAAIGVGYTF